MRLPVGFKNIKGKKKTNKKTKQQTTKPCRNYSPPFFFFPVQSFLHNSSLSGWQIGTGEARRCSDEVMPYRRVPCRPWPNGTNSPLGAQRKLCTPGQPGGIFALVPPCLVCAWVQMSSPRQTFLPRDRYNKAGESLHCVISFHGSKIKAEEYTVTIKLTAFSILQCFRW